MFVSYADHVANPPDTWKVVYDGWRTWHVRPSSDCAQSPYGLGWAYTEKEAVALTVKGGYYYELWHKYDRWYAGEPQAGWKQWADVKWLLEAADQS
jgi:hypothetical protein